MMLNLHPMKNYFIMFFSILLLPGCASLPKYTAPAKSETGISEFSGQYNPESKVRYNIEHDSVYVYMHLSTSDFSSQVKILNFGLTVYIDETGRKKNGKYITFPLAQPHNKREMFNNGSSANNFSINQNEKSQQLFQFFQMNNQQLLLAGFDGSKSNKVFNYPLKNGPVQIKVDMNFAGILYYTAIISKAEIFSDINSTDGAFSIGVKSGAAANQMNSQSQHSGSGMRQGSGAGKSGGMGGRGGGGKSGGGMPGYAGGNQNRGNYTEMSNPIEFWFQVETD